MFSAISKRHGSPAPITHTHKRTQRLGNVITEKGRGLSHEITRDISKGASKMAKVTARVWVGWEGEKGQNQTDEFPGS